MDADDKDEREEKNIIEEDRLSKHIIATIQTLSRESKALRTEYKKLLKDTRKAVRLIQQKEADNAKELAEKRRLAQGLTSTASLKEVAHKLRTTKEEESKLSLEEAKLLQAMLNQLYQAHKHSQAIMEDGKEIHDLISTIYEKDLADYELEIADNNKA